MDLRNALPANRQARNVYKGGTADSAIGRKQRSKQTFAEVIHQRDQGTSRVALFAYSPVPGSPVWVLATAEDAPPPPSA